MRSLQNQPGRVDELEGLRGLLALWVALAHIAGWCGLWIVALPGPLNRIWTELVHDVFSAVDVFLILSGFAITFLLHQRHQSYIEFMTGRFFRIYPVYIVCLVFGAATSSLIPFVLNNALWRETIFFDWAKAHWLSEQADMSSHVFWHVTLFHGLIPKEVLPHSTVTLLTPAWSISLEWQFYLVAPLLMRWLRSGIGLLALAIIASLGLQHAASWNSAGLGFLPAQLPLFLIGIGSYHVYAWFRTPEDGRTKISALPAAALLAFAVIVSWHRAALIVWAVAFGCVFIGGQGPFARALGLVRGLLLHRWLQRLGKISYPLYLVHWPIIIVFLFLMLQWQPTITASQAALAMFGIGVPLMLLAAEALHRIVERPLMRFGRKVVEPPKVTKVASPALEPAR